jgi:hypothetical protein
MKTIRISIMAIAAALTLFMTIGMLSIQYQQQVWSPRNCGGCVEFIKMTHEFEKNMVTAISEGTGDEGDNDDLESFVLFMRSTFTPDPALDNLIANYEEGVGSILTQPPPDDGKPHDQIKEFKQLTRTLRTEVLELAHEGFLDEPR